MKSGTEIIAEGLGFPEGPVVMADGSVIVVEVLGGRVTRCWNDRKETVCETGGGPNGGAIGPDGAYYLCNNGGFGPDGAAAPGAVGRIERIDLATGRSERLYEVCGERRLSAPNDLMFDCDGNLWFTDLGRLEKYGKEYGGLYCCKPDGSAITRIVKNAISYNGVGISPDMRTVYAADYFQARIYAVDRKLERQQPRLVANVPGEVKLDSLAMTAAGNVCVAAIGAIGASGAISTVTPDGQVTMMPTEDQYTTNIAFGGADMRDAYITYSLGGMLVKMRGPEPGMRLVYNA
jgi:gluconolactonase